MYLRHSLHIYKKAYFFHNLNRLKKLTLIKSEADFHLQSTEYLEKIQMLLLLNT